MKSRTADRSRVQSPNPPELRRIRVLLSIFVLGLMGAAITAIPLDLVFNFLYRTLHYFGVWEGPFHDSVQAMFAALLDAKGRYPFVYYATDRAGFLYFTLALAFIGPLRDPLKNVWLVQAGVIAWMLLIPFVLILGAFRETPWWWRAADCVGALIGFVVLGQARKLIRRLESPQ